MGSPVIFFGRAAKFLVPALDIPGSATTNLLTLQPHASTAAYTITFPAAQGGAGTVPTNDGAGNLTWQTPGGGGSSMLVGRFTTAAEADANTELLITFDTGLTIVDYGVNQIESGWTFNGAATVDATQVKFGAGALNMDIGHNGNVWLFHVGDNAFTLGTGDFTIDFWVRSSGYTSVDIVGMQGAGNAAWYIACFSGNINFGTVGGGILLATGTPSINAWHHIAVVRSSGTTTMYIDGTSAVSASDATNYNDNTDEFHFGAITTLNANTNCFIDEFRLSNIARWTSNFTPPTAPYANTIPPEVNPGGWIASSVVGTAGQTTLTFTTPFTNEPIIQLTPINLAADPTTVQLVGTPTTTGCVVQTYVSGVAAAADVEIYAISS